MATTTTAKRGYSRLLVPLSAVATMVWLMLIRVGCTASNDSNEAVALPMVIADGRKGEQRTTDDPNFDENFPRGTGISNSSTSRSHSSSFSSTTPPRSHRKQTPSSSVERSQTASASLPPVFKPITSTAPSVVQRKKVYKFYDAGGAYHDMNFSCPVAWEWTGDIFQADALWYNILDNVFATAPRADVDGQKFVFMSLESAAYYPQILDVKDRGFDFAVDYRIWPEHPAGPADIPAVYLTNPTAPDFRIDFRARPHFPKRKDAIMAVFISNCSPQNERNRVLEELMQLIPVHSYGGCMNNIEEPEVGPGLTRRQAKNKLAQQYYFIYTPENSNDHSYVSEKVYDGFDSGALPVYIGAPDIIRFIPDETSIINHSSFNSTADLAAYMKELVEDEEAYLTHFAWKQKPWSDDFSRVLRLASRTVQCRLAMHLEGLDFEEDLKHLDIFPPK